MNNSPLHLSLLFLLLNAIILFALAANISRKRMKLDIGLGHGENKELLAAIRAHANSCEYIPIISIMFVVLEMMKFSHLFLIVFMFTFIIARIIHAYGASKISVLMRQIGATLNYICMAAMILAFIFLIDWGNVL